MAVGTMAWRFAMLLGAKATTRVTHLFGPVGPASYSDVERVELLTALEGDFRASTATVRKVTSPTATTRHELGVVNQRCHRLFIEKSLRERVVG
jgi:hypothetical protein